MMFRTVGDAVQRWMVMGMVEKLTKLLLEGHKRHLFYDSIAAFLIANDVVPVVRCKNCTSYNTKGCASGFGWCIAWDQGRMDDNFCHCGERKNNE
jgi:hypothetical protein